MEKRGTVLNTEVDIKVRSSFGKVTHCFLCEEMGPEYVAEVTERIDKLLVLVLGAKLDVSEKCRCTVKRRYFKIFDKNFPNFSCQRTHLSESCHPKRKFRWFRGAVMAAVLKIVPLFCFFYVVYGLYVLEEPPASIQSDWIGHGEWRSEENMSGYVGILFISP
jgi:hypothetical protein